MTQLLSKDHRILQKGMMEFRPFGVDLHGHKIRDASGVKIRAFVDYLEESVSKKQGKEAGQLAVQELCRLLKLFDTADFNEVVERWFGAARSGYPKTGICQTVGLEAQHRARRNPVITPAPRTSRINFRT